MPTTIIGVMRNRFRFPSVTDIWLPLSTMPSIKTERRTARALNVVARLADSATISAVRAQLAAEADRLSRTYPATNAGVTLNAAARLRPRGPRRESIPSIRSGSIE